MASQTAVITLRYMRTSDSSVTTTLEVELGGSSEPSTTSASEQAANEMAVQSTPMPMAILAVVSSEYPAKSRLHRA